MTEQIKSRFHAACNQILSLTINPDFNFLACELGRRSNKSDFGFEACESDLVKTCDSDFKHIM